MVTLERVSVRLISSELKNCWPVRKSLIGYNCSNSVAVTAGGLSCGEILKHTAVKQKAGSSFGAVYFCVLLRNIIFIVTFHARNLEGNSLANKESATPVTAHSPLPSRSQASFSMSTGRAPTNAVSIYLVPRPPMARQSDYQAPLTPSPS